MVSYVPLARTARALVTTLQLCVLTSFEMKLSIEPQCRVEVRCETVMRSYFCDWRLSLPRLSVPHPNPVPNTKIWCRGIAAKNSVPSPSCNSTFSAPRLVVTYTYNIYKVCRNHPYLPYTYTHNMYIVCSCNTLHAYYCQTYLTDFKLFERNIVKSILNILKETISTFDLWLKCIDNFKSDTLSTLHLYYIYKISSVFFSSAMMSNATM